MKRNWLTYVAIVAALVAGIACSTALADGKGGSRSRGSSARSMSGGGGGSSMKFSGNTQAFKSQGGGNLSQGLKKVQLAPSGQFKTMPGNFNSSQLGKNLSGQTLNKGSLPKFDQAKIKKLPSGVFESKPQINLNSEAVKNLGSGVLVKKPGIGIKPDLVGKLPPGFLGPKTPIGINPDLVGKLPPGFLGPKYPKPCPPINNPCYNPCNNWCGPTWWWSPWYNSPCYTGCYYPSIYTYPQPIIVEVPVATTVVAGAAVAPAAAVEPVAEKLLQIPVGSTITLQGQDLGDKAGQVVVQIDKISLPAQMNEWKVDSAVVTLPMIGLAGPTKAQLWMVKADGAVATNMAVELVPAQPPVDAAAAK